MYSAYIARAIMNNSTEILTFSALVIGSLG